jgi:hypothetical protein
MGHRWTSLPIPVRRRLAAGGVLPLMSLRRNNFDQFTRTISMKKFKVNSMSAVIGTSFAVSLAASPVAGAADNPFSLTELAGGFTVAEGEPDHSRQCGNFCGGSKPTANEKGEMVKCGNVCAEVSKCGNICGGFGGEGPEGASHEMKDGEVAKCGNICAATG